MTTAIKSRSEILPEDQWNVSQLYSSLEDWEKDFADIGATSKFPHWPKLQNYKGHLKDGTAVLKDALDFLFSLSRRLEKLFTYAHLRHDEEITLDAYKSAFLRISSLMHDFNQETSWLEPEILELSESKIQEYLNSPILTEYRFHLEKIRRMSPHTLSADKEELLAMAAKPIQTSSKAFSALNNADIQLGKIKDSQGNELELSHGLYHIYLRSSDRILRANAFITLHEKYLGFENTLAELLYGEIQSHHFEARARHYHSSLEAALFPKKIPLEVYRSLIDKVRSHLKSLHHYVSFRKKFLNLQEAHLYDMYVPLIPEVEIKMGYQEAEDLVIESTAPLGSIYQNILKKGLQSERWVDRYENKNKRSGGYSSGCYDSFPYILMNYRDTLRDVFTLAHEAGHSMHSYLSQKTQPYHYYRYPIFVAEVASTFNEELLMDLLMKKREKKEERLFLINQKIEDIRSTFFRQTMFAEFELKIHELVEQEIPLTPTLLKELYLQLNIDYFGPDATIDPEIAIEWARIPHFYYNFYVYQYATGLSAAITLAENVLQGNSQTRENYLAFLASGGSSYPMELLQRAGVDISTSIEATIRKFDSLVHDLERLALQLALLDKKC